MSELRDADKRSTDFWVQGLSGRVVTKITRLLNVICFLFYTLSSTAPWLGLIYVSVTHRCLSLQLSHNPEIQTFLYGRTFVNKSFILKWALSFLFFPTRSLQTFDTITLLNFTLLQSRATWCFSFVACRTVHGLPHAVLRLRLLPFSFLVIIIFCIHCKSAAAEQIR